MKARKAAEAARKAALAKAAAAAEKARKAAALLKVNEMLDRNVRLYKIILAAPRPKPKVPFVHFGPKFVTLQWERSWMATTFKLAFKNAKGELIDITDK